MTGGAQGIGFAVAERLAASGASISIWDRDESRMAEAAGQLGTASPAHTQFVEVTDPESVSTAVTASVAALGGIDIMINSAGIAGPTMPAWDYPIEAWKQVIDVDLNGVYYCCRYVLPFDA